MSIEVGKTERGFANGEFVDRYGSTCSIQKSSLATEDCIWLGVNNVNPQIMCSDAIRLGLRVRTYTEADNGWCDFPIPKEVMFSDRMHLTQEMVADLLPLLQRFVETGELYER